MLVTSAGQQPGLQQHDLEHDEKSFFLLLFLMKITKSGSRDDFRVFLSSDKKFH